MHPSESSIERVWVVGPVCSFTGSRITVPTTKGHPAASLSARKFVKRSSIEYSPGYPWCWCTVNTTPGEGVSGVSGIDRRSIVRTLLFRFFIFRPEKFGLSPKRQLLIPLITDAGEDVLPLYTMPFRTNPACNVLAQYVLLVCARSNGEDEEAAEEEGTPYARAPQFSKVFYICMGGLHVHGRGRERTGARTRVCVQA